MCLIKKQDSTDPKLTTEAMLDQKADRDNLLAVHNSKCLTEYGYF